MRYGTGLWGNVKLRNGREVELRENAGWVEWRYVGDSNWTQLFEIPADGEDGADGQNGTDGTDGQDGADGREIELQENNGWVEWRYVGDTAWNQLFEIPEGGGSGGTGTSEAPELHLDFEEAGDEFTYNVPYAMKFTSQVSEVSDATLSIALNTTLNRYDKLTITATAAGLVSLYGEYVED